MGFFKGEESVVVIADVDDDTSRPSVAVRRLRQDHEKMTAEMQHLLEAKRRIEDAFLRTNQEMDASHMALQREKAERMKLEEACADLKRANAQREVDLERERKKFAQVQDKAAMEGKSTGGSFLGGSFLR